MHLLTNSQLQKGSGVKGARLDRQKICWSDCFLPNAVLSALHDVIILEPNREYYKPNHLSVVIKVSTVPTGLIQYMLYTYMDFKLYISPQCTQKH